MQVDTEVWVSDKGGEEIHHFVHGETNLYLFGFNQQLLGEETYQKVRDIVEQRIKELDASNDGG